MKAMRVSVGVNLQRVRVRKRGFSFWEGIGGLYRLLLKAGSWSGLTILLWV